MKINVTKTYLPPIEEYNRYLKKIWKNGWLTNNGELVVSLEEKLKKYLNVKHVILVNNATLGLQIALRTLNVTGEVITTPYSYIASTTSILWENCKPVFVDIDPVTLCIDVSKIEQAITSKTQAIFAVHVYGNCCDIEALRRLANKHKLKVIYDAAHAFSIKYKGESVLTYGDISVVSFHATKIFHTIEGGAIITENDELAKRASYLRNFGHKTPDTFWDIGTNAKMNEMQAAMGLCILPKLRELIDIRKELSELYDKLLKGKVTIVKRLYDYQNSNYGYYPVIFRSEKQLMKVMHALQKHDIFPRRYFYPSINTIPYVVREVGKFPCRISESTARSVLCLPLYPQLQKKQVKEICSVIINTL